MSRWYRFLYRIGITPWESDTAAAGDQIRRLLTAEESRRGEPYGRALDLGCGTGRWSIELASRGWEVVGVDVVPQAIGAARHRAQSSDVEVTFLEGDVTRLRDLGAQPGFSLFLDVECFNHLDDAQREAVGREIDALAEADATLLMLVWRRARRGPLPPGAAPDDLARALPRWRIVDDEPYEGEMPAPLKRAAPRWYRLFRT